MAKTKSIVKTVITVSLLILSLLLSSFVAFSMNARAAESTEVNYEGKTFATNDLFTLSKHITPSDSITFETEIFIPEAYRKVRGVLISNYNHSGITNPFSFEIGSSAKNSEGKLRVYSKDYANIVFDTVLASEAYMGTDENPKYLHVGVTVDTTNKNATLYLNGTKIETKTISTLTSGMYDTSKEGDAGYLVVGNDKRDGGSMFFRGYIKNVGMYSGLRSEAQIAADKTSGFFDTSDSNLLFAYDLCDLKLNGGYLNDYSANANTAVNSAWTINSDTTGRSFTSSDALFVEKNITEVPNTFEAVVYAPTPIPNRNDNRAGVIFGNYYNDGACLNFELHQKGAATVYMDQGPDNPYSAKLGDVLNNYGWVHIAMVRELLASGGAKYTLYVDGRESAETILAADTADLDMQFAQEYFKFSLGRDSREGNGQYFKGKIKKVALYTDSLSANQILSSYKSGGCESDGNYILKYDMTELESSSYVRDLSGNGYNATQGGIPLESINDGRSFDVNDELALSKNLTKQPMTYEALIYAPSTINRTGVIWGNYSGGGSNCINFEIHNNGAASIYFIDKTLPQNQQIMSEKFDCDVRGLEWVHLVITHTVTENGATFDCYINGVLEDTITSEHAWLLDMETTQSDYSLTLGRDWRGGNEQYFKGKIKNVAIYDRALSANEITSSYTNGVDTQNSALMAYYDLTSEANLNGDTVTDGSGNGYTFSSLFTNAIVNPEDYAYSFAVIPDTQKLVYKDAFYGTDYTSSIYDWLAKNKDKHKIKFVMGLGDITDKDGNDNLDDGIDQTNLEWNLVVNQLAKLTNAGIPYSLVQGNHDTVAQLDKFFAANTNFTGADIGYYKDTSLGNYFIRFTAGGNKYMLVVLQYGANDSILKWANEVIAQNSDYSVIVTTHAYMFRDGTTLDINDVVPPRTTVNGSANNGDDIWNELVSKHDNIIMAMSGHDPYANIAYRKDFGDNGNTVHSMLIDFQSMDLSYAYETGMVAMLYFSADGKRVKVEYVSTYKSQEASTAAGSEVTIAYRPARNTFSFEIPDTRAVGEETEYGIVSPAYSDKELYPVLVFKSDKSFVGGYYDIGHALKCIVSYEDLSGSYVVALRGNVTNNVNASIGSFRGNITVDLGGYTVENTNDGNYILDIYVDNSNGYSASYTFKNGTLVKIGGRGLVCLNYHTNMGKNTSHSFFFENVTFRSSNSEKIESVIFHTWENGWSNTFKYVMNANAVFEDCTFDMSGSVDGAVMLPLTYAGGKAVKFNVVINGGKILADTAEDYVQRFTVGDTEDSVTYGKGTNGYTEISLPAGESLPSVSVNDGELTFVKTSSNTDTVTYKLANSAIASFTPKASVTLDSNLIFNIYIPKHESLTSATVSEIADFELGDYSLTEDGKYYIVPAELSADEAAKVFTLKVTLNINGTSLNGKFTFSTVKYAQKLLTMESASTSEKTLAKDMLAYIKSAYEFFNADDKATVAAEIDEVLGTYSSTTVINTADAKKTVMGLTGATFVLDAKPAVRFYFSGAYAYNLFSFKVGERALEITEDNYNASENYVEFSLFAYEMTEVFSYTVKDTEIKGEYNLISYYAYASGNGENDYKGDNKATLTDVTAKFYNYCASAKAYRQYVLENQ